MTLRTCREGASRSRGGPAAGSPLGAPGSHPAGAGRVSPRASAGGDLQKYLRDGDVAGRQRELAAKLPDPAVEIPGFTSAALWVKEAAAAVRPSYLSKRPNTQHGIKRGNWVFFLKKNAH